MKYLYPYECEKLKLRSLGELQSAIDGNRREGRRPGYGYDFSPLPPPPVGMMTSGHLGPPSGPMGQLQMSAGPHGTSIPQHLNGASLHPSLVAAAAAAVSASSRPGSGLSAKGRSCDVSEMKCFTELKVQMGYSHLLCCHIYGTITQILKALCRPRLHSFVSDNVYFHWRIQLGEHGST